MRTTIVFVEFTVLFPAPPPAGRVGANPSHSAVRCHARLSANPVPATDHPVIDCSADRGSQSNPLRTENGGNLLQSLLFLLLFT